MADKPNPYRFTIRDLLIATAGLGVLLFIWRREGIYLAGSLTLTLATGVLLVKALRQWPIQTWRAPFATCSVLSVGNVVICLLITHAHDRWTFINVSSVSPMFFEKYHVEFGALNGIIALLISTALIICFIFLLKYSRWNLFAPLWILFNLAFISLLIRNYFPSFEREMGEEVSQGYFLGLVVLLLPIIVRWIQNLPTESFEIPELNSESDDSESQQVAGDEADKPSPANKDETV